MNAPKSQVKRKQRSPKRISEDKWSGAISETEAAIKATEARLAQLRRGLKTFNEMKEQGVPWPDRNPGRVLRQLELDRAG